MRQAQSFDEDRVAEALEFLALVSEPLPDTVSYWDARARCRFANRAFESWYGLDPEKMIGRSIRELLGDELYATTEPYVLGALAGDLQRFERVQKKADGRVCHVLLHYVPHRIGRDVVGFVALASDHTDWRRAEAELRELTQTLERRVTDRTTELRQSEERFRQVFEEAPVPVLTVDPAGRVALYNAAAERLFGPGRVGQPAEELFPWPGTGRRSDGSAVPIERAESRIRIGDEAHVLVFVTDLTERRRLEAERDRMSARMAHAEKLEGLGVLAGGIAHDFNNLLTGVLAHAELLAEGAPVAEAAAEIRQSAQRAADLCHQLLAFAGRGLFSLHPTDLSALVADAAGTLRVDGLTTELARDLPPVEVDAALLRTALSNLVRNAVEAVGPGGSVVIRTGRSTELAGVPVGELPVGETVYVEVADDGPGMDPQLVDRIFDPFYSTKSPGRGLGLSAVQGIARGHGGAITIRTRPGEGTAVRLILPARPTPVPESRAAPAGWRGSGRVLVADDERIVRSVARRLLERLGFDVELVEDGEAAVERVRAAPTAYRLVMLDQTMPKRTGSEALVEIRAAAPSARVVLMSGYSAEDLELAPSGPDGFLAKPFEIAAFTAAVRAALEA